jgi:uncharacterized lipoprotein YddW (UPF0748 family)
MKKILGFSCLLIMFMVSGMGLKVSAAYSSDSYKQPIFELRGAWVATVSNIDIARQNGLGDKAISDYKDQYLKILDTLEKARMNAVFFQVRPANDAFYPSQYNAWSSFMAGDGINPGWDPLDWMVEETHKRGMEFHAWLNPYRVSAGTMRPDSDQTVEDMKWEYVQNRQSKVEGQNIQNPLYRKVTKGSSAYYELMEEIVYGTSENKLFLNPAKQATIDFISETINEIITNYEVDGVHFDDYFYPSGGIEAAIDNKDYQTYGTGFPDKPAWRRNNVDRMVKAVHDVVENFNANTSRIRKVRFGISPAAVWAPKTENCTAGSGRGVDGGMDVPCGNYSSYHDLNADTRKWVVEEWIDYILPQAYMTFGSYYVPVVSWWAQTVRGTSVKLYVGLAPYRYVDGTDTWKDEYELAKQVVYNNTLPEVSGTVYFSYKNIPPSNNNYLNLAKWHVQELWSRPVLNPVYNDMTSVPIVTPATAKGYQTSAGHQIIFTETAYALGYVLYRFGLSEPLNFTDDKVYTVVPQKDGTIRHVVNVTDEAEYVYVLKTVDLKGDYSDSGIRYSSGEFDPNSKPVISNFQAGSGLTEVPVGSNVHVSFEATDVESENLTVKLFVMKGSIVDYTATLAPISGNTYQFDWKAYYIETQDMTIKVTVNDGSDTTEAVSAPFCLVIPKQPQPEGYQITVEAGKVIITGLENAEYSLDGKNYEDIKEFAVLNKATFKVYLRTKAVSGYAASDAVIETVTNPNYTPANTCPTATITVPGILLVSFVLGLCYFGLRKRG